MLYHKLKSRLSDIWKTSANDPSEAKSDDRDLIRSWRNTKNKAAITELQKRHNGLVQSAVFKYQNASIPRAALEMEAWKLFDEAVNNYQLNSPAKFSTFASFYLFRLDRYTKSHQNVARIPEAISSKIGDYDRAVLSFKETQQREPTHKEVGKIIGLSPKRVKTLEIARRKDLFEGGFEGDGETDANRQVANQYIIEDAREVLDDQEREIYDMIIGYGGKRKVMDNTTIAKRMKISSGRVSQIKGNIARKIKPYVSKNLR